jgi:O-antigen/teichoic acid export membrane protein
MLAAIFLILVVFNQGILVFGIGQLILQTVLLIIFFILAYKKLSNDRIDHGFIKHSLVISLVGLGYQIITPGIQLYLNYTLGPSTLAYYVIANRIKGVTGGAAKSIMNPVVMRLAKKSKTDHSSAVIRLIPISLVFGLLIYGCVFLGIHYLGPLVISNQYAVSLFYAKILTLVVILAPLYSLLKGNVLYEKNNRGYAIPSYTEQAIQFIGYVLFVSKYGIPAIGIINLFAYFISIVLIIWYIKADWMKQ